MDAQRAYTELLRRHRKMIWRMCWLRSRGDYERCRDFFKELINLFRQMNYSEFKSENFEKYRKSTLKFVEDYGK